MCGRASDAEGGLNQTAADGPDFVVIDVSRKKLDCLQIVTGLFVLQKVVEAGAEGELFRCALMFGSCSLSVFLTNQLVSVDCFSCRLLFCDEICRRSLDRGRVGETLVGVDWHDLGDECVSMVGSGLL